MDQIDLRSDTVTWPTPEMREAMAKANVGDDVYEEDPTANALEAQSADMLGQDAGLFFPSGTMSNLAAILAHCGRGDEMILGDTAHTFLNETGSAAALGGVHPRPVPVQNDGTMCLADIRAAIRPDNVHYPISSLITIENTHNAAGGAPLTPDYTADVAALAAEFGLKFHIDGARIFNAAAALDCDVRELCESADSVTFCLSKGLCAPVGAILVGSEEFIRRARRARKGLGGGMRQVGVLAAAGLIALNEMTKRLADDHATARQLAEGLAGLPGIEVNLDQVWTNMVYFRVTEDSPFSAYEIADQMLERGIVLGPRNERYFRAVTHYWITPSHIEQVLAAFQEIIV